MTKLENKTIITVAPTGAWPSKQDNPAIPLTPTEIADDVVRCWESGAAVAHLHMRDDEGQGTMSLEKFEETVSLIRARCDVVLNLTTSGDLHATEETRMAHLRALEPELASYDCGSMNWMHQGLFLNPPDFLEKLGTVMKEHGIRPEVEVFDTSFLYNALYYVKKGVLDGPPYVQLCLGAAGGMAATIENLVYLKGLLPEGTPWSAFGIGRTSLPILLTTVAMGGHVRVGMEDNVLYARGRLAASNSEFVERAGRVVREAGREVASPEDARAILNLRRPS